MSHGHWHGGPRGQLSSLHQTRINPNLAIDRHFVYGPVPKSEVDEFIEERKLVMGDMVKRFRKKHRSRIRSFLSRMSGLRFRFQPNHSVTRTAMLSCERQQNLPPRFRL
jgi:hypothetical protein